MARNIDRRTFLKEVGAAGALTAFLGLGQSKIFADVPSCTITGEYRDLVALLNRQETNVGNGTFTYYHMPTSTQGSGIVSPEGILTIQLGDTGVHDKDWDLNTIPPSQVELFQNYPNPFGDSTALDYIVGSDMGVRLDILNERGRLVKELFSGKAIPGKTYRQIWDGTDNNGTQVANNGRFYGRLTGPNDMDVVKMVKLAGAGSAPSGVAPNRTSQLMKTMENYEGAISIVHTHPDYFNGVTLFKIDETQEKFTRYLLKTGLIGYTDTNKPVTGQDIQGNIQANRGAHGKFGTHRWKEGTVPKVYINTNGFSAQQVNDIKKYIVDVWSACTGNLYNQSNINFTEGAGDRSDLLLANETNVADGWSYWKFNNLTPGAATTAYFFNDWEEHNIKSALTRIRSATSRIFAHEALRVLYANANPPSKWQPEDSLAHSSTTRLTPSLLDIMSGFFIYTRGAGNRPADMDKIP